MYYQNYEDYMRQVLGYPINDPSIYETYDYRNHGTYEDTYSTMSEDEIRDCYPEIYHSIYPMVCKVCEANTHPINKELIEKMTDEVYFAVENTSTIVNIRANVEENRNSSPVGCNKTETRTKRTPVKEEKNAIIENRADVRQSESRQINSNLRDLIKILLLFRLFGNRPGRPPRPPRPSFPGHGRPPFPGGRPPIIQPRDYNDYM